MRAVRTAGPGRAVGPAAPTAFKRVAIAIELRPLFGIAQDRVGLLNFLELIGSVLVSGTHVGMVLARELLVSLADLLGGGVSRDAQRLVVVEFGHEFRGKLRGVKSRR